MKKQANNWDQKLWPPKLNNPTYLSTVSLQRCVSFISKYLHDLYFFIPHVSIFSSFLVSFFQMNHLKACWACETISAHLWKNKPHFHIASATFFSSYCSKVFVFLVFLSLQLPLQSLATARIHIICILGKFSFFIIMCLHSYTLKTFIFPTALEGSITWTCVTKPWSTAGNPNLCYSFQ